MAMEDASAAARRPTNSRTVVSRELWPIIGVCLVGYAIAGYIALQAQGLDQVSTLVMQSNVW